VRLLLDACTFLWFNADSSSLSPQVKSLCVDPENDLYLSVTSAWEITLKYMVGRLQLPVPAAEYVYSRRIANQIESLDLSEACVVELAKLPSLHSDPFDRILVCQAIVHGLAILTPDEWITRYPVNVIW